MDKGFKKIILSLVGICLAYILFYPAYVYGAGCCKIYSKDLDKLEEIGWTGCAAGPLGCVIGRTASEILGRKYWPKEECQDASTAKECNTIAGGRPADFDDDSCEEIESCKGIYTPTTVVQLPDVKPTSPLCWPESECLAVCKGPEECWSGPVSECLEGRGYCYSDVTAVDISVPIAGITQVRDLGSYIALIYNYLVGVVIIVAIVMIIYGGFRWVTAAGSAERISGAKQTIISAVVGLLLALFSYTLLNAINPDILRLSMPRIKRVRPIYFEVTPARCQDYTAEAECKKNEYGFNSEYGGCTWQVFGGWGEQCTIAERDVGKPGNVCTSAGACSGTQCVEVRYLLGPYASQYTTPQKWCTDGTTDMPCKYDTDCNKGLKCDDNIHACVGIKGGRPTKAECDSDGQCSSGFCDAGVCGWGKEKQICKDDSDCAEGQGYQCVQFTEQSAYCCPRATLPNGHGCYIGCVQNSECGEGMYCWKSGTNASFKGDGGAIPRRVREWDGNCYKIGKSGDYCYNEQGGDCESGVCNNFDYYKLDELPETIRRDMIRRAPEVVSPIIEDGKKYDQIGVGRCQ